MKWIFLAAVVAAAVAQVGCGKGSPEAAAITQCQEAIRQVAKNPSGADVPYTKAAKEGADTYRMVWRHGDGLRLQNGFGAMIDTTAICVVRSGKIYALDVGDQQIL